MLAEEQGDGLAACHCREMNMLGKNLFLQGNGRISKNYPAAKGGMDQKFSLLFHSLHDMIFQVRKKKSSASHLEAQATQVHNGKF